MTNPTPKDGQSIDRILRPAMEYAANELQGQTLALDIIDGFIDEVTPAIEAYCAEREVAARAKMRQSFIREFTNDHNGEIRWLRGVALSRQAILVEILYWLDSYTQHGSQEDE